MNITEIERLRGRTFGILPIKKNEQEKVADTQY